MSEIVEAFSRVCRDEPDRALVFLPALGRTIRAAELWSDQRQRVERLTRAGIGAGDLVVCGAGNRVDFIGWLLACRSLGIVLMPVDPGTSGADIVQLNARFGAAAFVRSAEPSVAVPLPGEGDLVIGQGARASYRGAAMLKLTSGSTGSPRATRTTDAQLVADGRQIAAAMSIGRDDTQLAVIPLSHSYALGVILMPLLLQGTPMILRETFVPQQLGIDARAFGAQRFPGVPFMFEHLLDHPAPLEWPPLLTRLVSAGAPLAPAVIRAFHRRYGVKVHPFYGTTETGGITFDEGDDPEMAATVGRALPGVTLRLVPEGDQPAGRVHVSSGAVSDGYVGGESGDFIDGGFLTGDYGTIAADGRLTLAGRVSTFINVAGRKVQPDEVEAVLRVMPGVADAKVIAGTDMRRGEQVLACLVLRPGTAPLTTAAVRRFCASRLAPHKIPRQVVFLERIPLTARGKTDRHALAVAVHSQLSGGR